MKRFALIALVALATPALAQTSQNVTNQTAPTSTNPKNNTATSCTQSGPGETHLPSGCATPSAHLATPAGTQPGEKMSEKNKAKPAAMKKTPPATPMEPATNVQTPANCAKSGTSAPTPSAEGCDSNSGIHEGGPFGH